MVNAQEWLENQEEYNTKEKRSKVKELKINGEKILQGKLDLSDFTELERLECCGNVQLTELDLRNCNNLWELNCSNNNSLSKDLSMFSHLVNLKRLDISNSPFYGNLWSLKNLNKLEELNISNTEIDGGLNYLPYFPESLKELYCKSDHSHKSILIAEELEKYGKCLEEKKWEVDGDSTGNFFYNIEKWKANKTNHALISIIPLERLFVVRSNIQQFLKKWGSEDQAGKTELSKIQSPEQFARFNYLTGVEWISTATTVVGGALTLLEFSTEGGIITLTAPLVGGGATLLKSNLYEAKKVKWEEFLADADTFLDNYHELLGILKQIEGGEEGIINKSLKNLNRKVYYFLNSYDKDRNEEIEIKELTEKREKFGKELGKVEEIVEAMKELEEQIINYRQGKDSIINELLQASTNIEENLKEKLERGFKKKFPKREINRILFWGLDWMKSFFTGEDIERKNFLIISSEVNNSNQEYYFDLVNAVFQLFISDKFEIIHSSDPFASESETIEKAIEMTDFKLLLTKEQERRIENKVKQIYLEEEEINEEKDREREKIIRELKRKLLKKLQIEVKKDKNKLSLRESLSLEIPEKQKELQESIDNQEIHELVDLQSKDELKIQVEIPPKGNIKS